VVCVVAAIAYQILRPKVDDYLEERYRQNSLRAANDPERRSILNTEVRRIRAEQQESLQKDSVLRKRELQKSEYERKKRAALGKKSSMNMMNPGPATPSYKPDGFDKCSGGG